MIPSTPNLQAWADQYYGVMKLRLLPDGYTGDYESAMESPTAPAGTPPTYGDQGFGTGNGAQDGESVVWGYGRGGNRGGADR